MEKSLDFYPCFHLDKRSNEMHLPNDCISSLPVEVLLIILSLLPLKEMVKTSILSKRWLNLWVNTPVLVFYFGMADLSTSVFKYFVNLVDHVLQQHKSPYLKEFRICCNIMNDHREYVDRWLEFALARKVQILELNFLSRSEFSDNVRDYVFPNSWFISSGKAIVDGGKSRVLQFNLKFLKSLILKNVNVTGETINFFLQNCPFLERLELVGSQIMVNLVISDPTLVLKYLKVKNCRGLKVLCISNINLVSLDTSIGDLILEDLPMLVELSIYGYANNLKRIVSQNATCLRQLKSLELTTFDLKGFTEMLSDLAQLTKLKRLVIHYGAYYDESLIVFLNVIKSCNYLEEFVLELDWLCPKRLTRDMQKVERFSCESLKLFEFKGYFGRASDVELIMHVVENAPRLEKIIIDGYDTVWRLMNYPEDNNEKEARRHALEHIKFLKQIKYIPPHVDVLIR